MAQNVLQNPTVLEVVKLIEGIDAADQWDALESPIARHDFRDQTLVGFEFAMQPADCNLLITF